MPCRQVIRKNPKNFPGNTASQNEQKKLLRWAHGSENVSREEQKVGSKYFMQRFGEWKLERVLNFN